MPRWGMTVDLQKCYGCGCCTVNCSQSNGLPTGFDWRQLTGAESGLEAERQRVFLTMACMHCEEPPCLDVCPTAATFRHASGVVDIDADLCMGCGYCVVACPYLARTVFFEHDFPPVLSQALGRGGDVHSNPSVSYGICTKCNFCLPRIEAGLERGQSPGLDPEATPVCVNTCLAESLRFGDLDDPESPVSRAIRHREVGRINEPLGTKPAVFYLMD